MKGGGGHGRQEVRRQGQGPKGLLTWALPLLLVAGAWSKSDIAGRREKVEMRQGALCTRIITPAGSALLYLRADMDHDADTLRVGVVRGGDVLDTLILARQNGVPKVAVSNRVRIDGPVRLCAENKPGIKKIKRFRVVMK